VRDSLGPLGATATEVDVSARLLAFVDRWAWILALLAIALCSDYKAR
jgi:hypothetical protein